MEDIRNHVKQGTDKLARCVGHLKVSTRLVFEQVLSGRVLCRARSYFPIWPWVKSMEHLAEPQKIAGSWQLPGITWYYLVLPGSYLAVTWQLPGTSGCSSEICSIPISARLDLYGPVMDLSILCCGHAALGFIMDSDRCCTAPACPQSISLGVTLW